MTLINEHIKSTNITEFCKCSVMAPGSIVFSSFFQTCNVTLSNWVYYIEDVALECLFDNITTDGKQWTQNVVPQQYNTNCTKKNDLLYLIGNLKKIHIVYWSNQ